MKKNHYNLIVSTKKGRSKIASFITLIAISLSTMVIIVALCITEGFKQKLTSNATKLLDYVHITEKPSMFAGSDEVLLEDNQIEEISQIIAPQTLKAGVEAYAVLQNNSNVLPTTLTAQVDPLVGEEDINNSQIILSRSAANLLDVEKGQAVDLVYFKDDQAKLISLTLDSIYSSNMVDMESSIAYISIDNARMVAGLDSTLYNYYVIKDRVNLEELDQYMEQEMLIAQTIEERVPQLFGWLDMIAQNFSLILIIMIVVAVINVLASTLIVILDNTSKIALLRSLGMNRREVAKVFTYKIFSKGLLGVLVGALLGLSITWLQMQFKVISLDEVTYLVDSVPIYMDWTKILFSLLIISLSLLVAIVIPLRIINKLSISKALKYE